MDVEVRSSNGITLEPAETRLFTGRRIFLQGEITPEKACDFSRKVLLLNLESREKPIRIYVNSPGGEINAGLLMYDVIQDSQAPIRMFCLGRAYSMAALLFSCGKHGRYMLPHSELMLHEPLVGNPVTGSSSSIRSVAESLMESQRKISSLLSAHTGRSLEEVEKATAYDHYFSPEESVEFGLCDGILTFGRMVEG